MIGLFWNCRGVSKKGMSTFLKELILEHQADFVGLQETSKRKYDDSFFRKVDPAKKFIWHWLPAKGRSRGMLCGVRVDMFEVLDWNLRQYSICTTVLDKKKTQEKGHSGVSLWSTS